MHFDEYERALAQQDYFRLLAPTLAEQVCVDCDIDLFEEQCRDLAKQNSDNEREADYLYEMIKELAWEKM